MPQDKNIRRNTKGKISVFKTEKKGFGVRADEDIPPETFLIEFVGEILNYEQFEERKAKYSKNRHFYSMTLRHNAIIEATIKGNISPASNKYGRIYYYHNIIRIP